MSTCFVRQLPLVLALGFAINAAPATAAADDANDDAPIIYTVQPGDTMIMLGKKYLLNAQTHRVVQAENAVRNPLLLPTGKKLLIRRSLLKSAPANARILSVRGNVTVVTGGVRTAAKQGELVTEGARLSTSESSFVTLALSNGSQVSLPSNSDVRVRLLRRYALGGSLDYDFELLKGGSRSKVIPLTSKDDRYRVRTPKAVSAVRGTDFQSRFDPASNIDFAEVVEGKLSVASGLGAASELPGGQGLAVFAGGAVIKETLLPAPQLIDPGKIQVNPALTFKAAPTLGETGYRFLLASDAGFVDQIADITVSGSDAQVSGLPNGNYFVRARAISANGIQGNPVTFAFKRRLNGVKGSAAAGADGFNFKWASEGEGQRSFHFQLFRGEPGALPMVDEPALVKSEISLSDLPHGQYKWRVGAVQFLDNEVTTNWTDFEQLSIAP